VEFDEAVDRAIFDIAQHDPSDENRRSLSCMLRSLPLVHGGLGIARYSWIPGHVGVIRSRQLLADFIETHYSGCFPDGVSNLEGIQIGERNCPLPFQFGPQVAREEADDWAVLNGEVGTSELAQEQYSAVASTLIRFIADREGMGSLARAAWFRSSQFEGSGRWLTPPAAVVMDDYLSLNADEYRVALRQRLLLAPFEDNEDNTHPSVCSCGAGLNDSANPFHFLDCIHNHAFNHARHADCLSVLDIFLRNQLKDRSVATAFSPRLHSPDGALLDANGDLEVTVMSNVCQVFDVVVSNPAAATFTNPPYRSHEIDDASNIMHEDGKLNTYGHTKEVIDRQFIPFAIEATGRMGPKAIQWIEVNIPEDDRIPGRPCKRTPVQILHAKLCTVVTKHAAKVVLYHRRRAWEQHIRLRATHA
jgi:hypothetical protein